MTTSDNAYVSSGMSLVWRRQRVLWWAYAVNFVLALLASLPVAHSIANITDHSRYADRMVNGFDLPTFIDLLSHPDFNIGSFLHGSFAAVFVFFVFMLFIEGGLLETYRQDRRFTTEEFFRACGAFFWRFVRLLVMMLIVLAPVMMLKSGVDKLSDKIYEGSNIEKLGFWIQLGGTLFCLLLMMVVRLWFDMAQVHAVAEDERAIRRSLKRAFGITFRNFGRLFWIYVRTSLAAWVFLAVMFWLWLRWAPPSRPVVSFLLGQIVLLIWMGTRFWQRAAETLWYRANRVVPAPPPVVTIESSALIEPLPAGGPGNQ